MQLNEALAYSLEEIRGLVHDTVEGLDTACTYTAIEGSMIASFGVSGVTIRVAVAASV